MGNLTSLDLRLRHNQVKDVRVPEQLQRAMAAEAEAAREARAKVVIMIIKMTVIFIIATR